MNHETLSKYRNEIIEKTINIEWLINAIISQHYFKKVVKPFLLEVLYDENFAFSLKRNILEKIVPLFDKNKMQDLRRLMTIRNYFAHCNQEFLQITEFVDSERKGNVPDPRNPARGIDFEELYFEFTRKNDGLTKYLAEKFIEKGGFFLDRNNNKVQFNS